MVGILITQRKEKKRILKLQEGDTVITGNVLIQNIINIMSILFQFTKGTRNVPEENRLIFKEIWYYLPRITEK